MEFVPFITLGRIESADTEPPYIDTRRIPQSSGSGNAPVVGRELAPGNARNNLIKKDCPVRVFMFLRAIREQRVKHYFPVKYDLCHASPAQRAQPDTGHDEGHLGSGCPLEGTVPLLGLRHVVAATFRRPLARLTSQTDFDCIGSWKTAFSMESRANTASFQ